MPQWDHGWRTNVLNKQCTIDRTANLGLPDIMTSWEPLESRRLKKGRYQCPEWSFTQLLWAQHTPNQTMRLKIVAYLRHQKTWQARFRIMHTRRYPIQRWLWISLIPCIIWCKLFRVCSSTKLLRFAIHVSVRWTRLLISMRRYSSGANVAESIWKIPGSTS